MRALARMSARGGSAAGSAWRPSRPSTMASFERVTASDSSFRAIPRSARRRQNARSYNPPLMRKIVLTFGLIAGAIMGLAFLAALPFKEQIGFDNGMLVGYSSMVVAFLTVYFGV